MKIDTKKCSPVRLGSPRHSVSFSSPAPVRLDDRDLVLKNPNPYIVEEDADDDVRKLDGLGRKVQHIPVLVYTPVRISSRKSGGGRHWSLERTTRTVTESEMDELHSCLRNLELGGSEYEKKREAGQKTKEATAEKHGSSNRTGRISKEYVDTKTGKTTIVLRSARFAKTTRSG